MAMHTPIRECIGCGGKFPKKELLRIVYNGGETAIDADNLAEGRGAYLCKKEECLDMCIKRKKLNRAFKCSIREENYVKLDEEMRHFIE